MNITHDRKEGYSGSFKKAEIADIIFYALLIAWPILHFSIFYIGVNFNAIMLCFQKYDTVTGELSWDWAYNFQKVFFNFSFDSLMKTSIKNSVFIYFVGLIFTLPMGQILSFYIYRKMRGFRFFKVVLFLPGIIPGIVIILIFKYCTDRILPDLMFKYFDIEFIGLLSNVGTALYTQMFFAIWTSFGSTMLVYSSNMTSAVNESCVEAAKLDGANALQEYLHVVFPAIYDTFAIYFVMGFIGLFSDQLQLYSLYGEAADPQLYTIGYYVYRNTLVASKFDYPFLSAIGMCLTVIIAPLALGLRRLLDKIGPSTD